MQTSRVILKYASVDQKTGHIRLTVFTETKTENATWNGPERSYGLDASMFVNRFNSDIEQVKKWLLSEHAAYTGVHSGLAVELEKIKGTAIGEL